MVAGLIDEQKPQSRNERTNERTDILKHDKETGVINKDSCLQDKLNTKIAEQKQLSDKSENSFRIKNE